MDIDIEQPTSLVFHEPELELAMPQIYRQPPRPTFTRGKAKIGRLFALIRSTTSNGHGVQAYQHLLEEYEPAIRWALASWDFLLTVEGYRYLLRSPSEQLNCHGDYRVFTERDLSRMVHRTFRRCVEEFMGDPERGRFTRLLKDELWPRVRSSYQSLRYPHDRRQRLLTDYSYLRCAPYQFLNRYHQTLVNDTLERLATAEREIVDLYFLRFFSDEATAAHLEIDTPLAVTFRCRALDRVGTIDPIAHALLLQIERY